MRAVVSQTAWSGLVILRLWAELTPWPDHFESPLRGTCKPLTAREAGSIDGTPVADPEDLNDQAVVFDPVHHAILSYSYPIGH